MPQILITFSVVAQLLSYSFMRNNLFCCCCCCCCKMLHLYDPVFVQMLSFCAFLKMSKKFLGFSPQLSRYQQWILAKNNEKTTYDKYVLCCNLARAKMYISILLRFSILLYVWFDRHGHILQIKECLLCFFVDFFLYQIVTKYYFQNLCLRFFSIFMLFLFFNINVLLSCQSFAYINIHSTLCSIIVFMTIAKYLAMLVQ